MFARIKRSADGLKKVPSLVGTSMFMALNVVIANFKIVLVPKVLELGFATLAFAACAYIYGPIMTGVAGVLCDTIKYFLNPTGPYMPLFAINEFLTGFIYGIFFYKRDIKWWRIICARLIVVVLINLVLTPLWLSILYGNSFMVLLQARLVKNICMLPIDFILLYFVLNATKRAIPNHILNKV